MVDIVSINKPVAVVMKRVITGVGEVDPEPSTDGVEYLHSRVDPNLKIN